MRYSFWGAKWRVWSLLFMGDPFFSVPRIRWSTPLRWVRWSTQQTERGWTSNMGRPTEIVVHFGVPWKADQLTSRSPGVHGPPKTGMIWMKPFFLDIWGVLEFGTHTPRYLKQNFSFESSTFWRWLSWFRCEIWLCQAGISETSGFTLGYPVIPGTSLRKPPGHHGFNLKISLQSTEISKGIGMRSTGQHAWSRRARGGEGATSWKHLHIRSVVYEMAWVCGKASHFPWFSSRGRLGSQLYLEINGSVSLGLAHYYDHSLVFQLIRPWKKSPNFPGSNDWPKSIVIHLGYSKIMPRPTKSRTIMIWF